MSRVVLLMRHADALPAGVGSSDHERPLSEWGRFDARRMAEVLQQEQLVPGRIVVSTATRTMQTVQRMVEHFGSVPVVEESRLYLATPSTVMEILNEHSKQVSPVLIVAHNPGLQSVVSSFADVRMPFPAASVAQVLMRDQEAPEVVAIWRAAELTLS
jgi:phosphohistidine phosphatase